MFKYINSFTLNFSRNTALSNYLSSRKFINDEAFDEDYDEDYDEDDDEDEDEDDDEDDDEDIDEERDEDIDQENKYKNTNEKKNESELDEGMGGESDDEDFPQDSVNNKPKKRLKQSDSMNFSEMKRQISDLRNHVFDQKEKHAYERKKSYLEKLERELVTLF